MKVHTSKTDVNRAVQQGCHYCHRQLLSARKCIVSYRIVSLQWSLATSQARCNNEHIG